MVIAEAAAGLTSLRTAMELLKALNDVSHSAAWTGKIADLNNELIAAQLSQMKLIEEKSELEKRILQLEDWEREKQRYELKALGTGVVAYSLKPSMSNGEPPHYLCANCCAAGKKSFLQQHVRGSSVDIYKCNSCGQELTVDKAPSPLRYRNDPGGTWQSY